MGGSVFGPPILETPMWWLLEMKTMAQVSSAAVGSKAKIPLSRGLMQKVLIRPNLAHGSGQANGHELPGRKLGTPMQWRLRPKVSILKIQSMGL